MLLFTRRLILIACTFFSSLQALKLNAPTILLNYMYDLPSNYTLHIFDTEDCFEWHSSAPYFVTVTPLFESSPFETCSRKAVVSSVGNEASVKKVTRITAVSKEHKDIKVISDVHIDIPKTIELQRAAEKVFINGPWMKISVVAKNELGYVFDSINGIHFNWSISCSPFYPEKVMIRFRMFSESNYTKSGNDRDEWEMRGLFSNSILVEGIDEGFCSIKAEMMDATKRKIPYQLLSTPPIIVSVSPNMEVHPSRNVHILRHSSISLRFTNVEGESLEVDPLDSSVSVSDPGIVKIADDLKTITGEDIGETNLVYKSHIDSFPEVRVTVQVLEPESLELQISRGGFTILEEMKSYVLSVMIRSDNKRITLGDNIRVKVKFPSKLFHVIRSTENGTYYVIQTLAPGSGKITAEFKGHQIEDGTIVKGPLLTTTAKIRVCHKLHIYPPFVLLPADILNDPSPDVTLRVSGGTNNYSWGLEDRSAATINLDEENSNVAKLRIRKESDFTVTATDVNNINLITSAKISIQPIIDIEAYPTVVEAEIGNTLLLPIALLGYECKERKIIRKFDDCSKVQPTVEIVNKHVLTYDNEPFIPAFGKGCLTLQFRCTSSGHSRINVFLASNNSELRTTTVLSCFKPLKPVHPVRVAVVALGASKEISFDGGPRKWPLFAEGHYTQLEASNPKLVDIELIPDPIRYNKDLTVFRILCKSLGETILIFKIGNKPSATIPHPAKKEASIMIVCSVPESVHLKVHKNSERAKKEDSDVVKVPFYGEKLFSVDLWIKDSVGRKFSNISTFNIEWELSDKGLATSTSYTGVTTYENAVAGYRKVTRDFKEFKMSGGTGELNVKAKINGYREDVLSKLEIQPQKLKEVSNSIDLKLVSLRDLNTGLYQTDDKQEEENVCDGDSCKS